MSTDSDPSQQVRGGSAAWANALPKAVAALLLVAGSAAALAGTDKLSVAVNSLVTPDALGVKSVTYSTTLVQSYAAYGVTIFNPSHGNIQNAWLKFSTSTNTPGLTATFDPAQLPAKCAIDTLVMPLNTGLVCHFAQSDLAPPGTSFPLLLPIPQALAGGAQASLALLWTLQAGQGNAAANQSQVVEQGKQDLVVKVGSPTDVRTWVRSGDTLQVADPTDGTGSKVKPPRPATVGLKQEIGLESCSSMYIGCFITTVSILDSSGNPVSFDPPVLFIDLFRPRSRLNVVEDPSEANETDDIEPDGDEPIVNAVLFYRPAPGGVPVQIVPCVNGPAWAIPSGSDRCVVPPYPANTLTYSAPDGWHFHIIARTNGVYSW